MQHIIQIMPIFELAGAQTMCENLVMELKKNKDLKCTVITFFKNDCSIVKRLKKNGIEVICLDKHKGFDIKIIFKLNYYLKKIKPDVIHTHLSALQYVYFAYLMQNNKEDIKLVHTIHNEAKKENKKWTRILQKKLFKKRVVPVAISKTIQRTVMEEYDLKEEQVPIVYNSIDLSKCIKRDVNSKFDYKFINIGRLTEQKNQIELVQLFYEIVKKYPMARLTIVGRGPLKEKIKNEIINKHLERKVKIIDGLDSCYKIMNDNDVFLMTSKYEGLPMTILEAMGTGLPVISYDAGGIKDIITNEINGYIAKDKNEFLSDVDILVTDKSKRKEIITNELDDSKKFNSKYMANEYEKIYKIKNINKGV